MSGTGSDTYGHGSATGKRRKGGVPVAFVRNRFTDARELP
jgi:hypothetical protein